MRLCWDCLELANRLLSLIFCKLSRCDIGFEKVIVSESEMKYSVKIDASDYCNKIFLSTDNIEIETTEEDNED